MERHNARGSSRAAQQQQQQQRRRRTSARCVVVGGQTQVRYEDSAAAKHRRTIHYAICDIQCSLEGVRSAALARRSQLAVQLPQVAMSRQHQSSTRMHNAFSRPHIYAKLAAAFAFVVPDTVRLPDTASLTATACLPATARCRTQTCLCMLLHA